MLGEQSTSVKLQCVVRGAKITFCERCQMLLEITYTNLSSPSVTINSFQLFMVGKGIEEADGSRSYFKAH